MRSLLVYCALGLLGVIAWVVLFERTPLPPLNQAVLDFAESKVGEQVGDGECWTLADQALLHANCRRPGRHGFKLYEFGLEIQRAQGILPGDILQFEGVRFDSPDGSWQEMPHHTAVVLRTMGSRVSVLHQNHKHVKRVGGVSFDLAHQTAGSLQIFRPVQ